jgi:hypothetical protein
MPAEFNFYFYIFFLISAAGALSGLLPPAGAQAHPSYIIY